MYEPVVFNISKLEILSQPKKSMTSLDNLLLDLTGRNKLTTDDPRWGELFKKIDIFSLRNFANYISRIGANDGTTHNVSVLLEHTFFKLKQMNTSAIRNHIPSSNMIQQCCIALHISSLIIHEISINLDIIDIGLHCGIYGSPNSKPHSIRMLLDELVTAMAVQRELAWKDDICFFSANLLLYMMGSQFYAAGHGDQVLLSEFINEAIEQQERYGGMNNSNSGSNNNNSNINGNELSPTKVNHSSSSSSTTSSFSSSIDLPIAERLVRNTLAALIEQPSVTPDSMTHIYLTMIANADGGGSDTGNGTNGILSGIGSVVTTSFNIFKGIINSNTSSSTSQSSSSATITATNGTFILASRCLAVLNVALQAERSNLTCMSDPNPLSPGKSPLRKGAKGEGLAPFGCVLRSLSDAQAFQDLVGAMSDPISSLVPNSPIMSGRRIIDLVQLSKFIASALPSSGVLLLLYSLLHTHPSYLQSLLYLNFSNADPKDGDNMDLICSILLPLLHYLYDCDASNGIEQLYLVSVCVLLMVQNDELCKRLSSKKVALPWYRERTFKDTRSDSLSALSLADATLLCVLRAVMLATTKLQDPYLASNCFAILLNIAPVLVSLHIYAAERLVGLLNRLGRKLATIHLHSIPNDSNSTSYGERSTYANGTIRGVSPSIPVPTVATTLMEDAFRILYQTVVQAICAGSNQYNLNLCYILAHDATELGNIFNDNYVCALSDDSPSLAGSSTTPLISPHDLVRFARRLLGYISGRSKEDSESELEGKCRDGNQDGEEEGSGFYTVSQAVTQLKSCLSREVEIMNIHQACKREVYSYEEDATAEAFFAPFAWMACIHSSSDMLWKLGETGTSSIHDATSKNSGSMKKVVEAITDSMENNLQISSSNMGNDKGDESNDSLALMV